MLKLDFYFSPGSRYSYLAMSQVPLIEKRFSVKFDWLPVSSMRIRMLRGVDPFAKSLVSGHPVSEQYDWNYRREDAERWAAVYNIPFTESHGFDFDLLVRAAIVARLLGDTRTYASELTSEVYARRTGPLDASLCKDVAVRANLNAAEFEALLESPQAYEATEAAAVEAIKRGVFGVPTFFIGSKRFWGNDRLILVEHELSRMQVTPQQ